jgi:hypothetical protein
MKSVVYQRYKARIPRTADSSARPLESDLYNLDENGRLQYVTMDT